MTRYMKTPRYLKVGYLVAIGTPNVGNGAGSPGRRGRGPGLEGFSYAFIPIVAIIPHHFDAINLIME